MNKSRLQEYCQAKSWELPLYTTSKEGFDHCPKFKASVFVNGITYFTPEFSKSSKEAQNLVAKLAFDQLSGTSNGSPSSVVSASSRSFQAFQQPEGNENVQAASLMMNPPVIDDNKHKGTSSESPTPLVAASSSSFQQLEGNVAVQGDSMIRMNLPFIDDKKHKDIARMCKNQLQIYAQKRNLNLPVYISEREGPPHAPRFKSKVMLNGTTYESQEYHGTIKDAENAAAKVALMSVSPVGVEEEDPGFFKNLLQELAQKVYSCLPEYNTISSGPSNSPIFVSTVDIKEESFTGQEAKTKKLAEVYAAKVAYSALKERKFEQNSQSEVPRPHVDDIPPGSSSKFQLITMSGLGSSEGSAKHAILTKDMSVCQKGSESKHVVGQLEGSWSSNQVIQTRNGLKAESLPQPILQEPPHAPGPQPTTGPGFMGTIRQWASTNASSPQKKIKVLPREQNMTLPPNVSIVHQDENWVAATMDSIHGNV